MKKKILCWSDSATASTGFGTVSRHIMTALEKTGKYELHHLAINYHGNFIDKDKFPWQIVPAKLMDPANDPYGNKMFLKTISENDYDYIWILNDTYVVHAVAKSMMEILKKKKKPPKIIYYYPVDCHVRLEFSGMLKACDIAVAYTDHGIEETLKVLPELAPKIRKIRHGTDTEAYTPLSKEHQDYFKKKILNVSPDTFVFVNVNRNSPRKQLSRTILAFHEFKKAVPNSILYCHTQVVDRALDISKAVIDLGMDMKHDVVFPINYSPSKGISDEALNQHYNMADAYLTTHLGEGWGLTVTEAMAAAVPVIAPNNTSMPEILGNGSRGYIYECKENIYIDNSGFRPMGTLEDIVAQMHRVYRAGYKHNNQRVVEARKWVEENNWETICKQWVDLFDEGSEVTLNSNSFQIIGETL